MNLDECAVRPSTFPKDAGEILTSCPRDTSTCICTKGGGTLLKVTYALDTAAYNLVQSKN